MASLFWEEDLLSAMLYDEKEKKEVPVNRVGFWKSSLRLRVRCSTPPYLPPTERDAARAPRSMANALLAISRHKSFAGIWRVLEVVEDGHVLVCLVPQDRFKPNDGGLAPPTFDLDWMPSGSGPADSNLCVRTTGSTKTAPRVRIAPQLTWHTRSTIYAISAVDTVAQRFTADLVVELRLRRACREGEDEAGDKALVKHMLDAYGFDADMIEIMNRINYSSGPERWVTFSPPAAKLTGLNRTRDYSVKVRAAGEFAHEYDLEHFPFDTQDVSFLLTLGMSTTRAQLVDNVHFPSLFLCDSFALGGVFTPLASERVTVASWCSKANESVTGTLYPRMRFSVPLARKYGYFMNNIIIPVGAITLMAPLSAATEPEGMRMGTGDRMAYSVTLLLTAVAYKFAIASSLPQVAYRTDIDSYVLICFGFMWLNLLESALWPSCGYVIDAASGEVRERFSEWWYLGAYVLAFALCNLYYAYGVHCVLAEREPDYKPPKRRAATGGAMGETSSGERLASGSLAAQDARGWHDVR